jgi:CheY-like chemotaxis protein
MHILLVEDNPEVSLITVEYLTELGHQTVAVVDAETALTRLSVQSFDTLMTDVSLPGMSGIELAKAVIKSHPRLPVVISSGYSLNLDTILGAGQLTVFALPKPYDLPTLERTLGAAASVS